MGRAKESVVARFTSFGQSTKHGQNQQNGVELQRVSSSRTSTSGHNVDVASRQEFPELGQVGLKPPRAPLYGPPTDGKPSTSAPGSAPRSSDDDVTFATRDRRRASAITHGGTSILATSSAHSHPHAHQIQHANHHQHHQQQHPLSAAAAAVAASTALSGSRAASGALSPPPSEVHRLEAELAASQAQCAALQQALNAARAGASASESAAQAAAAQQAAFEELAAKYVAQKAEAKARMAQAHTAATRLLSAFQAQGYEVAAGLDSLQDDLEELENLVLCGVPLDEEGVQGQGTEGEGAVATPVRPAQLPVMAAPATPGTPPPPDPNREKLVVLKARREHVEGEFLELVRTMVTGLERLGELSAPHHVAASTGTTPLGKAAAPAGPLEDE